MHLNDDVKLNITHIFTASVYLVAEDEDRYQYSLGVAIGILITQAMVKDELLGWFANYLKECVALDEEIDGDELATLGMHILNEAEDYVLTHQGNMILLDNKEGK